MKFRKNRASGIIWYLYACAIAVCLTTATAHMIHSMEWDAALYVPLAVAFAALPALLIYMPVQSIVRKRKRKTEKKVSAPTVLFTVLLLIPVSLFIRILCFSPEFGNSSLSEESVRLLESLFSYSRLLESGSILSGCYGALLSAGSFVTDHSPHVLFGVNILLQTSAVMFVYFAVLLLAGQKAGAAAACFLLYPLFLIKGCFVPDEKNILLSAGALLLFLTAASLYLIRKKQTAGGIVFCLTAFLCGAAVFMNNGLIFLFIVLLAGIWKLDMPLKGRALYPLNALLFAFTGFVLTAAALWLSGSQNIFFPEYIMRSFSLTEQLQAAAAPASVSADIADYMTYMAVLPFCLFYVFGISGRRENSGYPLAVSFLFLISFEVTELVNCEIAVIRYLYLASFGGLGFSAMLTKPLPKKQEETSFDAAMEFEENPALSEQEKYSAVSCPPAEANREAVILPGQYLPNPLPVPKRKVHKEMNYAFDPDDEKMCFDHPVSDTDDFDLP